MNIIVKNMQAISLFLVFVGAMSLGGCASDGFPRAGVVVAPKTDIATRALRSSVTDLQKELVAHQKMAQDIIRGRAVK